MAEKLHVTLEDGTGEILTALAGSERKRGEWISGIARAIKQGRDVGDSARLTTQEMTLMGVCARLNEWEGSAFTFDHRTMTARKA